MLGLVCSERPGGLFRNTPTELRSIAFLCIQGDKYQTMVVSIKKNKFNTIEKECLAIKEGFFTLLLHLMGLTFSLFCTMSHSSGSATNASKCSSPFGIWSCSFFTFEVVHSLMADLPFSSHQSLNCWEWLEMVLSVNPGSHTDDPQVQRIKKTN